MMGFGRKFGCLGAIGGGGGDISIEEHLVLFCVICMLLLLLGEANLQLKMFSTPTSVPLKTSDPYSFSTLLRARF